MIGLSRTSWVGKPGQRRLILQGQYTGTQVSSPVTLDSSTNRQAAVRVLRDEWNAAGTTVTLRVYRLVGGVRGPLLTAGTVDSGPATFKGVAQPNPAMPSIHCPALADGDYELEVVTSGPLRYTGTVED